VSYTLSANVERLVLTGTASIQAVGNTSGNVLTGNSGHNFLNGGAGADAMAGGLGNDVYVVDNGGDVVTEAASAGTDTVQSSIAYTLGANVERLTLIGTGNINGATLDNILTGNSGNNTLAGGAGEDTLSGGAGNDVLTGGGGLYDNFVFSPGFGRDTITDFNGISETGMHDHINLSGFTNFDSLADVLAIATQSGANTVLTFDAQTSLTIQHYQKAALIQGNFIFA
jgi:Ca2+-binding RTX toxin-like protein